MFAMSNSSNVVVGDNSILESNLFTVQTGPSVKIPYEIDVNTFKVRIDGFARVTTAPTATGQVQATYTPPEDGVDGFTTLTFYTGDVVVGDDILVNYWRRIMEAQTVIARTDSPMAKGELHIHWPVYSGGSDCTESATAGVVHVKIYRVRVSAPAGFDTSFKTASTNTVTFSSINPKRADRKMFEVIYERYDSNGEIMVPDADSPDFTFEY